MFVVPIMLMVLSLTALVVQPATATSEAIRGSIHRSNARGAAEAAATLALAEFWSMYQQAAGEDVSMFSFRSHLDEKGLGVSGSTSNAIDFLDQLNLPRNAEGRPSLQGVEIASVLISRVDSADTTDLIVDVQAFLRTGIVGGIEGRHREGYSFGFPEFEGLDYALLANNLDCLLCHTTIDDAARYYNRSDDRADDFDAVQVGSLSSFRIRHNPDSKIAGTLLLGGTAIQSNGQDVTNWHSFNLKGNAPGADGDMSKITVDEHGRPLYSNPLLYDPNRPDAPANVVLDFFDHEEEIDSLEMPESFPSPFPDTGGYDESTGLPFDEDAGNRVIDDSEFAYATRGSTGSLSGGTISVQGHGSRVSDSSSYVRLTSGTEDMISEVVDGNVYLHGTKEDPLLIDGDIAIDGDVIVSGYVKGEGALRARGNVYVAGDLVYADGEDGGRTFGVAPDGTRNNIAIAAGGNVTIGDYFRKRWGRGNDTDGTRSGSWNFTMDEIAVFNQGEWLKSQDLIPSGEKRWEQVGTRTLTREIMELKVTEHGQWQRNTESYLIYVAVGLSYEWRWHWRFIDGYFWHTWTTEEWVGTGRYENYEEAIYDWVDVMVPNPDYRSDYIPRYYSFGEGKQVPIFNRGGRVDPVTGRYLPAREVPGSWNDAYVSTADPNDPADPYLYRSDGAPKAVISSLGPTDSWIDEGLLRQIIHERLQATPEHESGKTVEVDATVYSSNSIMGVIPGRNTNLTEGKLHVNGGLVGADVGLLAGRGMQINFDQRGSRLLSIRSERGLELQGSYRLPFDMDE